VNTVATTTALELDVADAGAVTSLTTTASRPAVGEDFFWFVRCSGTGANLLEAGYRLSSQSAFTTTTGTLGATIAAPATINLNAVAGAYYCDKRMWNVKLWDRALTQAELLWESHCQRVVFPTSLNGHWWLRNTADLADRSGNGRTMSSAGTLASEDEYPLWVPRAHRLAPQAPAGPAINTKVMTDTLAMDEQFQRYAFRPRDASEVLSFSDARVSGAKRGVVATESVQISDVFVNWTHRIRQGNESINVTDGFVSWRRLARLGQDNLDLLDGFSRSVIGSGTVYGRVLSDSLTLTDGFISWRRLVRLLTDNADLLDGFSKTLIGVGIVYARVMSDTTTVIDDAGRHWTLRTSRLSDALGLSDAVIRALARIRILGENVEFSDGAIRFLRAVRVPMDTLDLSDELVRAFFPDQIFTVALVFGTRESFRMSTYDPMVFRAQ
jgi:hypothetical protein